MQRVTTQAHEGIETEDELVAYQKAAAVTTQAHEGIETSIHSFGGRL